MSTTPNRQELLTEPDAPADDGLTAWIARLYAYPGMLRMGHNQCAGDLNLGLGWIYYGLARLARPAHAVVIGSWRGFVPMLIARACQDNCRGQSATPAEVTFIDPSLVDDFWKSPEKTRAHFAEFGIHNIRHHLATTQQFVETEAWRRNTDVGLLFIDGYHTAEQARFDYLAFEKRLAPRALVLFHDSMGERTSGIYGKDRAYEVTVRDYMDQLRRDPALQLIDLPWGTGLTVMRKVPEGADDPLVEGIMHRF